MFYKIEKWSGIVIAKLYFLDRDRKSTSTQLTTKSVTTQKLNQGKKSGNQIHQLT
jgi:hypothetical protein